MKTININLVQPRVDNAAGTDQTTFAVMADDDKCAYIILDKDVKEWRGYGFRKAAEVVVTHPAIMSGDIDDVRQDMVREVEAALIEDGICEYNEAEALFIA